MKKLVLILGIVFAAIIAKSQMVVILDTTPQNIRERNLGYIIYGAPEDMKVLSKSERFKVHLQKKYGNNYMNFLSPKELTMVDSLNTIYEKLPDSGYIQPVSFCVTIKGWSAFRQQENVKIFIPNNVADRKGYMLKLINQYITQNCQPH